MFILVQSVCSVLLFFFLIVLCLIYFYCCIYLLIWVFQSELKLYLKQNIIPQTVVFTAKMVDIKFHISSVEVVAGQNVPYIQIAWHCVCNIVPICFCISSHIWFPIWMINGWLWEYTEDGGVQIVLQINIWNNIICTIFSPTSLK